MDAPIRRRSFRHAPRRTDQPEMEKKRKPRSVRKDEKELIERPGSRDPSVGVDSL